MATSSTLPSGGGYGPPEERDATRHARDVRDHYVFGSRQYSPLFEVEIP